MAVPHPAQRAAGHGQAKDHRVAAATRVIEDAVDDLPSWDDLSRQLARRLKLSRDVPGERTQVQDALLAAELDLEYESAVVYDRQHFRRPGLAGEPVPAESLRSVADAV